MRIGEEVRARNFHQAVEHFMPPSVAASYKKPEMGARFLAVFENRWGHGLRSSGDRYLLQREDVIAIS